MKKHIIRILTLGTLFLSLGACKKDYGPDSIGPLQDSKADIPVTVTNKDFFERVPIIVVKGAPLNPTVAVTSDSPFTITFEIPAGKGVIREISRVQTGVRSLELLQTGKAPQAYNFVDGAVKPIPGNNTNTITFTSSLKEYRAYRTRAAAITAANGGAVNAGNAAVVLPNSTFSPQNPNQLRYFFLLTLGDGTQIIPMEVRLRIAE